MPSARDRGRWHDLRMTASAKMAAIPGNRLHPKDDHV